MQIKFTKNNISSFKRHKRVKETKTTHAWVTLEQQDRQPKDTEHLPLFAPQDRNLIFSTVDFQSRLSVSFSFSS